MENELFHTHRTALSLPATSAPNGRFVYQGKAHQDVLHKLALSTGDTRRITSKQHAQQNYMTLVKVTWQINEA
jgi:hypothetical protein